MCLQPNIPPLNHIIDKSSFNFTVLYFVPFQSRLTLTESRENKCVYPKTTTIGLVYYFTGSINLSSK